MLMRTDPFRELDRLTQQMLGTDGTLARPSVMPMDAWRDGDTFQVEFDLPGVDVDSIDLDVERNVVTVKAERPTRASDAELIAAERPRGVFSRQLILGRQPRHPEHQCRLQRRCADVEDPGGRAGQAPQDHHQQRQQRPAGHQRLTAAVIVMSKISLPAGAGDTGSVDARFLDLLLADDDLVQAEFDAIIAAEWPGPPPNLPRRRVLGGPDPGGRRRHRATATQRARAGRRPALDGSARQRSPPPNDQEKTDQEKGR